MLRFTARRFLRRGFACHPCRGFSRSQMRSTDEFLNAADTGAKFTFPADNTVEGRVLKLETDFAASTATLSEQMRIMNANLTKFESKFEAKIDNLIWRFLTFGVGAVLLGGGAFAGKMLYYDGKMKDDMLETVKTLITASETSIKSEIRIEIGKERIEIAKERIEMAKEIAKEIRAAEERVLLKLDQMVSQK